jgi:hypothetical protein
MSIVALAPERRLFHFSEVIAYEGTVGLYLALTGQTKAARVCLELIESLDADHRIVKQLRQVLSPKYTVIRDMLGFLTNAKNRMGFRPARAMVESRG